jgi:hypothetical protein
MAFDLLFGADPGELQNRFVSARPFPHVVLDGLFPDDVLDKVLGGFPAPADPRWQSFDNDREKKLGNLGSLLDVHPAVSAFLQAMNAPPMLAFLEELTGISGLLPDTGFGGGGLHQIVRGGFLKIHADFNWHPRLKLDRRLNMLIYLNKDWREEYGGHLELWSRDLKHLERSILPIFNRTVVFATTDFSYHGHPRPLSCPEGRTRKSVSLYYYSDGRPEEEKSSPHDTLFPPVQEEPS